MVKKGNPPVSKSENQHRVEWRIAWLGAGITVFATSIAVGASLLSVHLQNGQETDRQVRAMKQDQYAQTVQAIHLELQSMRVVIDKLARDDTSGALSHLVEYEGADDVVQQTASLALVSDADTTASMVELLEARSTVHGDLLAIGARVDAGERLKSADLDAARNDLGRYEEAQNDLVLSMRTDLGLPGDLERVSRSLAS